MNRQHPPVGEGGRGAGPLAQSPAQDLLALVGHPRGERQGGQRRVLRRLCLCMQMKKSLSILLQNLHEYYRLIH